MDYFEMEATRSERLSHLPALTDRTSEVYEAMRAVSKIRRDFAFACRVVAEEGVAMAPEIFKEWVAKERAAAARFELAVAGLR